MPITRYNRRAGEPSFRLAVESPDPLLAGVLVLPEHHVKKSIAKLVTPLDHGLQSIPQGFVVHSCRWIRAPATTLTRETGRLNRTSGNEPIFAREGPCPAKDPLLEARLFSRTRCETCRTRSFVEVYE